MNKISINNIYIIITVFLTLSAACSTQPEIDINNEKIRKIVENNADSVDVHRFFPDKDVRKYLHKEFNEFYKNRDYTLAWLYFDEPKEVADELLLAIDAADKEGLSPNHYNIKKIEELLHELYSIDSKKERRKEWRKKIIKSKKFKERFRNQDTVLFNQMVKLDFLMTASYLTYGSHLLSGKIKPNETADWFSEPRQKDLSKHLEKSIENGEVMESLMALNPPHPQYDKLKEQLVKYKELESKGGWEKYKITQTLQPGDTGMEVRKLRARLYMEGLHNEDTSANEYDKSLEKSIQTFQMLHGLEVTGKVDKSTIKELNEPVNNIIEKIAFNMERMRWLPGSFSDHYILVNIPAFQMSVIKDDKVQLQMKAIVGETVNKTPVFYDSLEYIVFSPEWNVPKSIAVEEMLPLIKEDPDYLASHNYMLFDSWDRDATPISQRSVNWDEVDAENFNFRIVEKPGRANSLGKVKFIFPNNNNIYLHDTPADHLFSRSVRNFSHGCIRLEKPKDFATYLLEDKGWTEEKVVSYMNKNEPSTVVLSEKIPVFIVYWTAWVDEKNGMLNLRDDVYYYDRKQMDQLKEKEKEIQDQELKDDVSV